MKLHTFRWMSTQGPEVTFGQECSRNPERSVAFTTGASSSVRFLVARPSPPAPALAQRARNRSATRSTSGARFALPRRVACHGVQERRRLLTCLAGQPDRARHESEDNSNAGGAPADKTGNTGGSIPQRNPQHQVPKSLIDWNEEWKAFVSEGKIDWSQLPRERPAPTVWTRSSARVRQLWSQFRARTPTWREVSRDWRFWVALLITLSVLSSVRTYSDVSHHESIPPGMRAALENLTVLYALV